jgi:methylenetetrahydrofolate dehydrogenase (NADP+)/methenyltetrahydrofolate cyclohydrolase
MENNILAGKEIAEKIKNDVKKELDLLKKKSINPKLVALQVGENPASKMYVGQQKKACEEIGIEYALDQMPEISKEEEILSELNKLNNDKTITGIILQMPLPSGIDARKVQIAISPEKDVEGLHPVNMGKIVSATNIIGPCTAMSAIEILKSTGINLKGLEVIIVGHSEIVGKPTALLLLQSFTESPTVTVCHIATKDLSFHTKRADILFTATGKAQALWLKYQSALKKYQKDPSMPKPSVPDLSYLVNADMVKEGVIIIDIAINRIPEQIDKDGNSVLDEKGKPKMKTVGDVDFEDVKEKAKWITPVPGGVGSVTTAMLLKNTIILAKNLYLV